MRAFWELPDENHFRFTGNDWLQNLLGSCTSEERSRILLLLWRAWWLREDCVHAKGRALVGQSVQFLVKYAEEIGSGMRSMELQNNTQVTNQCDSLPMSVRRTETKKGKQTSEMRQHCSRSERRLDSVHADLSTCSMQQNVLSGGGQWEPPPAGFWKLNSDASFIQSSGETTAGFMVRNCLGLSRSLCLGDSVRRRAKMQKKLS
jgi:hypothetical protein